MVPGAGKKVLRLNPTAKEMRAAAIQAGWREITRMPSEPPESFNWATHSGECPDCVEDELADDAPLFSAIRKKARGW